MSLVVDTSIILAVLTNEKSKSRLLSLTKGEELIAPSSLHWEVGNALSAMMKRKRINCKIAEEALTYYSLIRLRLVEIDLLSSLRIASEYNIYAYDAYFLECSQRFNSPLISLDSSLLHVANEMKIKFIGI